MKKAYNVIAFFKNGDPEPMKWRNVTNWEGLKRYLNRKKIYPWYLNYYDRDTKRYSHREYLQETPVS